MSKQDGRTPLLDDGTNQYGTNDDDTSSVTPSSCSSSRSGLRVPGENPSDFYDQGIVAIFVVRFDTNQGNIVEWFAPASANVEGLAFKAMASGLHAMDRDYIFFKKEHLFGAASYDKVSVAAAKERNVRMRSVGILCNSHSALAQHEKFLTEQSRERCEQPDATYDTLRKYYEAHQKHEFTSALDWKTTSPSLSAGQFGLFLSSLGHRAILLWKAVMLNKRILFYSPPPVGMLCNKVLFTTWMALQRHSPYMHIKPPNPLYYISVADIDHIRKLKSYVACTTESIFKLKPDLYDIYVDVDNFILSDEMKGLLETSSQDTIKANTLKDVLRRGKAMERLNEMDEELRTWFGMMNNVLFDAIGFHQRRHPGLGYNDEAMEGTFRISNSTFFLSLVELYGLKAHYEPGCCGCC
eukprot:TRINITY_DN1491_c0_g5_i1.p1 TRINITY_DN1491_c0_g5~~TRINITY_DN1491_c0_g5_i1.p1  ORF type:complete len:410 (+),score=63.21 TRINITY_DN1491_c0_g5_i1:39-1268(+)